MARKPRFDLPGTPQHVIQRGNNRDPCFFAEADYRRYLELLSEAAEKNRCAVHAYVLMTNHVHLLITAGEGGSLPGLMQTLGARYVRYINATYRRTGGLWEGRYKASLVDSQRYVLTCYRYIELNPVRAAMVEAAGDYRWSSHRATAYGEQNPLLVPHDEYLSLGRVEEERRHAYRELFRAQMKDKDLHDVREALNGEMVLGSERFKERIGEMTARAVRPRRPGRPRVEEDGRVY